MITCTQCGQENPAGARFCNGCGAPLAADPAPAREVRKTVTVLFCDVVGSTALGERFDPEVLRALMARFYATVREPVERHGGTVEKVIGDALVAVFGIPAVHEDDALRALRAALEVRDAVRALGDIQARIGVNTGDVLARDATAGESLVVGDAVNVTARLEQAAAPGEVLVGEATWALVGHAARGERVAPIAAKGKREPLVAWRLESIDPGAGSHRRRLDLPMVGRDAELDLLRRALERTDQVKRPHLVTVLGQPGIGKSRLVSEVSRLRSDLTVLVGHCRATTGPSSLEPLHEVVRAVIPDAPDASAVALQLMAGESDAASVAACLAPDAMGGGSDVAWAVSRLIGTMTIDRTVVVVLEDVHWADDLLLDVVEQLITHARRRSLLVVCTARPEFAERRPGWGAGANTMSLALESLDDTQTRVLLSNASPGLPAERTQRVIAAAEGNPLFAEHLAALIEEGDAPVGLPRSIQVLLTARLEALPESERELVSVAAVAGREFPAAAVEALAGGPDGVDLDHLEQRELIEPTTPGRWQFGHALLQEAAYELIPKGRRAALHEALAGWLLESNGSSDAVIGDHLHRAVSLRIELGLADDQTAGMAEQAGVRLTAAGRRADAMGDPRRAQLLLERALQVLPEDSPHRPAAMVELAAAGWNLLTTEQVLRLLNDGAELAARHGLRALELRARILVLGAVPDTTPLARGDTEVSSWLTAALGELETLDDPRALATALSELASVELWLGRAADAVASAHRSIDVLLDAEQDTVWALSVLVRAVIDSPMPIPEADALLGRLTDELGARPTVRSELILGRAALSQLRGQDEEARALLDEAREIERDVGRRAATGRLARWEGVMRVRAGRYEEAGNVLRPIVEELEQAGATTVAATIRGWVGLAEVRLGRLDEAEANALAALEAAPPGVYEARTRAQMVLAEVHLARGEADRAAAAAREALSVASTGDWSLLNAGARLTLARCLAASGEPEAAAEHAREAVALYRAKGYATGARQADELLRTLAWQPE